MHQPELYHRSNKVTRLDAEQIYKEFSNKLKWREDGYDTLLDIGCGPGDVLIDFIYPLVPKTRDAQQIMGIDISPEMIEYARHLHKGHEYCKFEVMDIGSETDYLNVMKGRQFDHITSHYCLHWVQNQRQALKNIYELLRPNGGDGILVYVVTYPLFDGYKELSKTPKWSTVTHDYHKYISYLRTINDPKQFITNILEEIGFNDIQVEVRNKSYTFKDINLCRDYFRSLCPFLDRIPIERHSEFISDFLNTMLEREIIHKITNDDQTSEPEIFIQYKILVACITK